MKFLVSPESRTISLVSKLIHVSEEMRPFFGSYSGLDISDITADGNVYSGKEPGITPAINWFIFLILTLNVPHGVWLEQFELIARFRDNKRVDAISMTDFFQERARYT